jgi:ribonuclease HI
MWVIYVDRSSQCQLSPQRRRFQYAIKLDFVTTNNEAEYEAVLEGLTMAREVGALDVKIQSDSQVVVG